MVGFRLIVAFWGFFILSWEVLAESSKPLWKELGPQQQRILKPLADNWNAMELTRKKEWQGIARRYPKMTLQEQGRIQLQMKSWELLTSKQRKQARERFKKMEQLPAQKRDDIKQRWYEYEQLSPRSSQKNTRNLMLVDIT